MICIIGDIHATAPSNYSYGTEGNYILEGCINTLKWIIEDSLKTHADSYFILLGDIFTQKDKVPNKIRNAIYEILKYYKEYTDSKFYILRGNHDNIDDNSNLSVFNSVADVINHPEIRLIKGNKVLFIPYDKEEYIINALNKYKDKKINLVVGHWGAKNSKVGKIINFSEGIDIKYLQLYKYVALGHYHEFQWLDKPTKIGVGSMYQEDWGELTKKYHVYFSKDNGFKQKETPHFIDRVEFVLKNNSIKILKRAKQYIKGNRFGFVFAKIKTFINDINEINNLQTKLYEYGFKKVDIDFAMINEDYQVKIENIKDSKTILSDYIEDCLKDIPVIDKKIYKNTIKSIVDK